MKVKVCPECGKHNSENAWSCADCGTTLALNTLIDTDDFQAEGQQALSEISPYFKQDVETVLNTVIQSHETVVYGCDITQLGGIRFGYLLITSHRLICVKFESETEGEFARIASSMANPLKAFLNEFTGRNIPRPKRFCHEVRPSGSTRVPLIAVGSPKYPLTAREEESRNMKIYNLQELVSVNIGNSLPILPEFS